MNKVKKLQRLHALTGMQFLALQTEMAELSEQERQLRENLAELSKGLTDRATNTAATDDPARIAGADIRWHRWVDQRKTTINTELATLLARQENCRDRLQNAFGKGQVTKKLLSQAEAEQSRIRQKKVDYES